MLFTPPPPLNKYLINRAFCAIFVTLGVTLSLAGCGGGGGGVSVAPTSPGSGGGNVSSPTPIDRLIRTNPSQATDTVAKLNAVGASFLARDVNRNAATLINIGTRPHRGVAQDAGAVLTINFGSSITAEVRRVTRGRTLIADETGYLGVYNEESSNSSNRSTSDITPESAVLGGGVTNNITQAAVTISIGVRQYENGATNSFFLTAEYAGYANIVGVNSFSYYYGGYTPHAAYSQMESNSLRASYTIPSHAAVGFVALTDNFTFLSNNNAGTLSADFGSGYATLNLTVDGYVGNQLQTSFSYLGISGFQMRMWGQLRGEQYFTNIACPGSGGAATSNCAGTFIYGDNSPYNITNAVSRTGDVVRVVGGFYGPGAEEVAGIIAHQVVSSGVRVFDLNIGFVGRGWGASPYVVATSAASKLALPNAKYFSADWNIGSGDRFTVINDRAGRPSLHISPSRIGTINTGGSYVGGDLDVTLFFRGAGADTPITLGINNSGLLKMPAAGPGINFPVSGVTVDIRNNTQATHSFNSAFYSGGTYDIYYFVGAEYAAFAYGFGGTTSIHDSVNAYYGAITPEVVMNALAAANLRATYTIPQGGAQGLFYSGSDSRDGRLLYNGDAGALAADFGAGLVALNLTVDGYAPSGARTDDFLRINGFQMTVDGSTFHNYHCPSSTQSSRTAGCGGGFDYTSANGSANALDLRNAAAGSNANRIRAGGMFAGPSAEEVAGGIGQFTNDGRTGMRLYFLGAGKGGRQ